MITMANVKGVMQSTLIIGTVRLTKIGTKLSYSGVDVVQNQF